MSRQILHLPVLSSLRVPKVTLMAWWLAIISECIHIFIIIPRTTIFVLFSYISLSGNLMFNILMLFFVHVQTNNFSILLIKPILIETSWLPSYNKVTVLYCALCLSISPSFSPSFPKFVQTISQQSPAEINWNLKGSNQEDPCIKICNMFHFNDVS